MSDPTNLRVLRGAAGREGSSLCSLGAGHAGPFLGPEASPGARGRGAELGRHKLSCCVHAHARSSWERCDPVQGLWAVPHPPLLQGQGVNQGRNKATD